MVAALSIIVDESATPHAKTLRPEAFAPFTWSPCPECSGTGIVTETRGDRHDRDVRCLECSGDGLDPRGMYQAHDDADDLTHVWASESAFDELAPAACGAIGTDTRVHHTGADEHCETCWSAMQAAKRAAGR